MKEECTLLNSGFDNAIQLVLGFIAMSILVIKRYVETPRRPVKMWAFDASKQAIGAAIAHLANLSIAIVLHTFQRKGETNADEVGRS